jgi:DNA-directed RNA polymerase subunit RPC12/RpoP
MLFEQLPLPCERCRQVTLVRVSEAQQRDRVACAHCGAQIIIDKDAASRVLAELELRDSTRSG